MATETQADPFCGIEGRIARELQQMHYSLPDDDSLLMAERAYALSEEHIIDRMRCGTRPPPPRLGGAVETLQGDGRVEAHVLRGVGDEPRVEIHTWQMGVPRPVLQLSLRQARELIGQIEHAIKNAGKVH